MVLAGPPDPVRPSPAGVDALVPHLAILRRPPARTDSEPALQAALRRMSHLGCASLYAEPGLTRLATVARGGARAYVVVFRPGRCWPGRAAGPYRKGARVVALQDMVAVLNARGRIVGPARLY